MVRWVVGSILHGVDPLSYFSFQPVLHDWCNKGRDMYYPVCGMIHIKEPYVAAVGFLSRYLSGPLPYVWHHITVNKIFPSLWHVDPGMAVDLELGLTGVEPGKISTTLYCYVMNMDEPLALHVEFEVKVTHQSSDTIFFYPDLWIFCIFSLLYIFPYVNDSCSSHMTLTSFFLLCSDGLDVLFVSPRCYFWTWCFQSFVTFKYYNNIVTYFRACY